MSFSLFRTPLSGVPETIEATPFVPITEVAQHAAPKGSIDPDRTKSWLRRALPVIKAHRGIFGLSLLMSFISLLTQVQIPRLLGSAINHLHTTPLRDYAELVIIAIVIREIANYTGRRFILESAYSFEFDLRNLIYEHLSKLSFPFYDRVQSGQLISRANSDVRAVQMYLVMGPTVLVQCAVVIIAFGEMFTINVPLTLVTIISLPLTLAVAATMRKKLFPVSWLIQSRLAEVATVVEENVSGVRVVKSFSAEQRELTTLAKAADRVQWGYIKDADVRGTWAPTLENLPRLGLAVILLYGGILAIHHQLGGHTIASEVGTLFTFQAYMLLFQPPFRQLGMVMMMGQRASASAKRIYEILDEPVEVVNAPGATDLTNCKGAVSFENVSFGYGRGGTVLSHLELDVRPGETLALVGRTGSGKSTIARLLNRSYDVDEGRLLIDGVDVRDYTIESIRANVGIVFDEPFLFSESIRDNISYGRPSASIDEVVAAAIAAQADGFIRELPDGYDTVIGERGYTLSGGQRQRLAIARTLLTNPPILILDDATSAIDVHVEQAIHAALSALLSKRTTIIIAHRLSTIGLADRVALVEGGRVVAMGTHTDLLENEPRYSEVLAQALIDNESELDEAADASVADELVEGEH